VTRPLHAGGPLVDRPGLLHFDGYDRKLAGGGVRDPHHHRHPGLFLPHLRLAGPSLLPTPHNLHPTPCTPHPTLYTLNERSSRRSLFLLRARVRTCTCARARACACAWVWVWVWARIFFLWARILSQTSVSTEFKRHNHELWCLRLGMVVLAPWDDGACALGWWCLRLVMVVLAPQKAVLRVT
jgi:hypothetical protein